MIPAVSGVASSVVSGLAYQWVRVYASGVLATSTSTTASTWTTQTSSFGTTDIWGVASNGTSLYVAVGDTGKLATSSDGTTWTQQTSSFGTTRILNVAYGNDGYWVAVGDSGKLATSTDGITWTQRTSGTANNIASVAWGNNLWVYLSGTGEIRTATDPTGTWTSRTSTLTGGSRYGLLYAKTQGIWVAGNDTGTTGALASSTDGLTWTARDSIYSFALVNSAVFCSNSSVIVCAGTKSLAPQTLDIQTSTNGTTYTDRTPAVTTAVPYAAASDATGFMLVAGYIANNQSSSDGTTWTDRGAGNAYGLCHSSGTPSIR